MSAISDIRKPIRKPRGRPRVDAKPLTVRVPPEELAALDAWIARQPEPKPSRPEALRRLAAKGLAGDGEG